MLRASKLISTSETGLRSDDEWMSDLGTADNALREDAVADLRDMLLRGLAKSLSRGGRVDQAFLEDVVQDAVLKILDKLDTFQGRSRFRTWAVTIAVRTAVSKMRKREWQNVSLDGLTSDGDLDPQLAVDNSETADQRSQKTELFGKLKELIDSELTERQWKAITAELRGMPLAQVAENMGTSPNTLYKVLHDARKKLRRGLESAGYTIEDVRAAIA